MKIKDCYETNIKLEDTGFGYTLNLINGKYKMTILYLLALYKPIIRFNEFKHIIGSISFKTLSSSLKELEADNLIIRKEYPQIPPKVEYYLSDRGKSLIPVLDSICQWGSTHKNDLSKKSK